MLQTTVYGIDPRWFEIEIIVFEQSNQSRLDSEKWQQQLNLPDVSKSIDFLTPDPSTVSLQQICLQGKMHPVLGMVPVKEIIESDKVIEELFVDEPALTETISAPQAIEENNPDPATEDPEAQEEEELPFIILDKELNQLNELRSQLARRRGYRPLLHISWRQPVENKKNSTPVRLFTGNNYSDTFNPDGDARVDIASIDTSLVEENEPSEPFSINKQTTYNDENNPLEAETSEISLFSNNSSALLPFNDDVLLTAEDFRRTTREQLSHCQNLYQEQIAKRHPDVWQLDGNIQIYVERYLHLETDLMLRIPGEKALQLGAIETSLAADKLLDSLQIEEQTNNTFGWKLADDFLSNDQSQSIVIQQVLNKYPMQQSRRIRSNEIHYIDHPLFGMLIQIRPYEKNTEDEDVPTAS